MVHILKAKVRICTASDRKTAVEASDKRAAFLLFGVGQLVPESDRVKYSIPDEMLEGVQGKPKAEVSSGPEEIGVRVKRVPDVPSKR